MNTKFVRISFNNVTMPDISQTGLKAVAEFAKNNNLFYLVDNPDKNILVPLTSKEIEPLEDEEWVVWDSTRIFTGKWNWSSTYVKDHLTKFVFFKNEDDFLLVSTLFGLTK